MEQIKNQRLRIISIGENIVQNFLQDSLACFSQNKNEKSIPYWWLYDEIGSQIFEEITRVPEYYLARCELSILKKYSLKFIQALGPETLLIELGSGSSTKTRVLLEDFLKIHKKCTYIPIDISKEVLVNSSRGLLADYQELNIVAIHSKYDDALKYIADNFKDKSKLIIFLGGSIGNMSMEEEIKFLSRIRESCNDSDKTLIGMDLMKDAQTLMSAYSDAGLVTEKFILNIFQRMNKELKANFNLANFRLNTQLKLGTHDTIGRIEIYVKSLKNQMISINCEEFQIYENENIHIEDSHKYTLVEIEKIAHCSNFALEDQWLDEKKTFSLNVFSPNTPKNDILKIENLLKESWNLSDLIFNQILFREALHHKPIELRHPFIFYYGHLTAFEKNQIFNYLLKRKSTTEEFDKLFERGIDPYVDDPTICHKHYSSADIENEVWPTRKEIYEYIISTRKMIIENISVVLKQNQEIMAQKGRVFQEVTEHTKMHAETLLYMIQMLDERYKNKLSFETINFNFQKTLITSKKLIIIPPGIARMGTDFYKAQWGWDNEFPLHKEFVEGFEIEEVPVTNGEFIKFIESGEYDNPSNWNPLDLEWKKQTNKKHPTSLYNIHGKWLVVSVFDSSIPIENAHDWPVYCSQAEASAYAKCFNKRLPTEAEYMRAAYGFPEETLLFEIQNRKHPWGNEEPIAGYHGNFDFFSWAPMPVGSHPNGRSAWGVFELVGNGWEWTSSTFKGFPGFEKTIPDYQDYSADFFDEHHYIMLGASWATSKSLIRHSFRNWFQRHYEYMFSKFRCVKSIKI